MPPGFVEQGEPDNGDGQAFRTPTATLTVFGGNVTEAVSLEDEISGSVDRHPVRLSLTTGVAGALALGGPWDVVAVEVDGRSLGTLTIADALRPDAVTAVAALSTAGVTTVLLAPTEDARAAAIAEQAGCPLVLTAPPGAAVLTMILSSAYIPEIPGVPESYLYTVGYAVSLLFPLGILIAVALSMLRHPGAFKELILQGAPDRL